MTSDATVKLDKFKEAARELERGDDEQRFKEWLGEAGHGEAGEARLMPGDFFDWLFAFLPWQAQVAILVVLVVIVAIILL